MSLVRNRKRLERKGARGEKQKGKTGSQKWDVKKRKKKADMERGCGLSLCVCVSGREREKEEEKGSGVPPAAVCRLGVHGG